MAAKTRAPWQLRGCWERPQPLVSGCAQCMGHGRSAQAAIHAERRLQAERQLQRQATHHLAVDDLPVQPAQTANGRQLSALLLLEAE
mmetsp:Transcript_3985/g.9328  ORF Transcript_3985/g.9328 Transcript_3985/m.9328 type:complete len:87 (+) Transcript_3985:162-422(+)